MRTEKGFEKFDLKLKFLYQSQTNMKKMSGVQSVLKAVRLLMTGIKYLSCYILVI